MTFLSALLGERRSVETPAVPLTSASLVELFAGQQTSAGVSVSEGTAHRVTAVYRAWSLIAGTIASLPIRCFKGDPPGGDLWAGDGANLLAYPGGRDELTGNPIPGSVPAVVFYETLVTHLLAWGNAYVVKVPNVARTRTVALDLLLPQFVAPRWGRKTAANPTGKEFVVYGASGEPQIATPADVIHMRAMGTSLLLGISPIGAARQVLGLSVAAEEYGARLFGSGSLMAGILSTPQRINQQKSEELKARWRDRVAGLARAHEVAVLDSGTTFQQVSFPASDSQFIESRRFQITEIARMYGIPPHMLGEVTTSTSWGTGIEQQSRGFNTYTLRPWFTRVEQGLSNELLPRGVNARFVTDELLRGDEKSQLESIQTGVYGGILTLNEGRARIGLPPLAGGNDLMFPSNYAPAALLVNPPPAPAPPADMGGPA